MTFIQRLFPNDPLPSCVACSPFGFASDPVRKLAARSVYLCIAVLQSLLVGEQPGLKLHINRRLYVNLLFIPTFHGSPKHFSCAECS